MKTQNKILVLALLLGAVLAFPTAILAQDQQSDTSPKPAARAYPPIGLTDDQEQNQSADAMQPDDRPLTGIQQLTIGTPPARHSYWVPGISYANFIQSNDLAQGGQNGWNSTSYLAGNLSLLDDWGTSRLTLNYSGGGYFSPESSLGHGQFHQLGAQQAFVWRRLQVTLLDEFAYLPESQFGFGGGSGIGFPGSGGSLAPPSLGLQGGLNPGQSILTAVGPRYTNSAGTQFNLLLTPRSSVTFSGVFGILRFSKPGNVESNDLVLSAGYNYQLSKTDTLGLVYDFSSYHFIGFPQAIGSHAIQAAYGKQITGRLALRLLGGPEFSEFRIPPGNDGKTQYVGGHGEAGLTYAFAAGSISLDYTHGVNNGSGVFLGATSDQVTGSATRRMTRLWSANARLGYARNRSAASSSASQNQAYNTIYIGAGLSRPFSRNVDFTLDYTAYIETTRNPTCAGTNCGQNFTTHQITVGLTWRARPFVLH